MVIKFSGIVLLSTAAIMLMVAFFGKVGLFIVVLAAFAIIAKVIFDLAIIPMMARVCKKMNRLYFWILRYQDNRTNRVIGIDGQEFFSEVAHDPYMTGMEIVVIHNGKVKGYWKHVDEDTLRVRYGDSLKNDWLTVKDGGSVLAASLLSMKCRNIEELNQLVMAQRTKEVIAAQVNLYLAVYELTSALQDAPKQVEAPVYNAPSLETLHHRLNPLFTKQDLEEQATPKAMELTPISKPDALPEPQSDQQGAPGEWISLKFVAEKLNVKPKSVFKKLNRKGFTKDKMRENGWLKGEKTGETSLKRQFVEHQLFNPSPTLS